MEKRDAIKYLVVGLVFVGLVGLLLFLTIRMTGFAVFETSIEGDFDNGTYVNTTYNGSAVVLVGENLSGSYTSQVFDAGSDSSWNNISWNSGFDYYQQELPDDKASESYLGGVNMVGNVLLMHMNNNWNDASGEGNDGTASGAIFSTGAKLGSHAGSFDGTNDYVNVGNDPSLNLRYTLTVSAWIKLDTVTPAHGYHSSIIGDNGNSNWWFYVGNNAKLGFLGFNAGGYDAVGSNADISAGQWIHVAATYNSSATNEVRLYINGQLDKGGGLDGPLTALSDYIVVGDRGNIHRLDGRIDELAVWNRTLSSDEILNIYKRGILHLNLTARSCDDDACSGEGWVDITDESPQDLSIDNNTYFQYKFDFLTDDSSYSPELYNVTIDYNVLNTAPSVSLVSPQDGATYGYNESLALNFSAFDSDGNLDSCWYNIDSGDNISLAGCANITFDVSGDGDYVLNIYVNDTQGEEASDSASFLVQVGAPTIVLHFPIDEYLDYQENIQFNYTPTDVDLGSCELWGDFDGNFGLNQTDTGVVSGQINSFNLNLNDGTYLWNIKCNDSVGNSAVNGNKTFYVDTVSPNVSLSEPSGAKTSRTVSSSWIVSDDNLDSCWYNVYRGESLEIGNVSIGCSTNSTSFEVTVDADFIFNFYVNDSAGNSNSTSSSFSVDASTPSSPPSGGGGGGGGSSRTTVIISNESKKASLQILKVGDIIAHGGDKKTLSLNAKNTGNIFLNNCKLIVLGDISSWIYSTKVSGIAPGESIDFAFDLNVPEEVDAGDSSGKLGIKCDEGEDVQNIVVSIPGLSSIIVKDIKQEEKVLTIVYEVDNSNLIGDTASVDVWVEDSDGYEITRFNDVFDINKDGLIERNVKMELENVAGIYYVYLAFSDDLSNFIRESVVLGEPEGTGFVVFDTTKGKIGVYAVFLLIMAVAVFFIWRRHGKTKYGKSKWFFGKKGKK